MQNKPTVDGKVHNPLEPRKSFATWSQTIVGKARTWTEEQKETAGVLCLVYGKFIVRPRFVRNRFRGSAFDVSILTQTSPCRMYGVRRKLRSLRIN